jgi:DedD protein
MPETLTPAALELKRRGRRRLIGGATIALLMVVFLPMIFDSEPRREGSDKEEIALTVPAKEGLPPLPPPAPVAPAPKAEPAAAEPAKTAAVASAAAPPAKAEVKLQPSSAKPEHRPAQAAPSPAKPETRIQDVRQTQPVADAKNKEGFAVQLGAFSDPENLKQLQAKMAAANISVYTEELKTTSGTSTRLRTGPYKTREQADKVLVQVKNAGVEGKVVTLP